MRKKKHPEHVNHERWLISYADFITLLFAFFVVMFAVSRTDSGKVGRFSESFSRSLGLDLYPAPGQGLLPAGYSEKPSTGIDTEDSVRLDLEALRDRLGSGADASVLGVDLVAFRNEFVLRFPAGVLFDSGNDSIKPEAKSAILAVGQVLQKYRLDVRVEGHTDDRPIHTARFRSNWDLSTSRATAVLGVLAEEGGVPAVQLSAVGYAEFRPLVANDTKEGQQQNRRVDIVIKVPERAKTPSDGGAP
jgi:chemotaxis protein MotB